MMLKETHRSVDWLTTNFDTVLETAINGYGPPQETTVTPHVLSDTLDDDGRDANWDTSSSVMHRMDFSHLVSKRPENSSSQSVIFLKSAL